MKNEDLTIQPAHAEVLVLMSTPSLLQHSMGPPGMCCGHKRSRADDDLSISTWYLSILGVRSPISPTYTYQIGIRVCRDS